MADLEVSVRAFEDVDKMGRAAPVCVESVLTFRVAVDIL